MRAGEMMRRRRRSLDFTANGYAVLKGFLSPALVAVLRREVDVALEAPPVEGCERPHSQLVPLRWNDRAVDLILDAEERRQALRAVTGGEDLRWISGYISVKDAHSPPLWWHQDWWCWHHPVSVRPAAAQMALLCYLGDTSRDSGALRVLPRSHRSSVPLHARLGHAHALGDALPLDDGAFADQEGQVTLDARAGDAVVLDYRLLHGTHPNLSAERRDCMLLSFAPCWRGLPAAIRAHLIQHLAQPREDESPARRPWAAELLPSFGGVRADLELNRVAPADFAVHV